MLTIMVKIDIEAANGIEAKRIKKILEEAHACRLEALSAPIDSKYPIRMSFDCTQEAIDIVLDTIKEPSQLLKLKPDEISFPKGARWTTEKRRRFEK